MLPGSLGPEFQDDTLPLRYCRAMSTRHLYRESVTATRRLIYRTRAGTRPKGAGSLPIYLAQCLDEAPSSKA